MKVGFNVMVTILALNIALVVAATCKVLWKQRKKVPKASLMGIGDSLATSSHISV